MLDDPPGYRNYWSAEHLDTFPDEAVDLVLRTAADDGRPLALPARAVPAGRAVARRAGGLPGARGAAPPGSRTRSACGRTRPTTSRPGTGRGRCAATCSRGRPAPSTSTSSATRAGAGGRRVRRRELRAAGRGQARRTTRTTSSGSTTTSHRADRVRPAVTLAGRPARPGLRGSAEPSGYRLHGDVPAQPVRRGQARRPLPAARADRRGRHGRGAPGPGSRRQAGRAEGLAVAHRR